MNVKCKLPEGTSIFSYYFEYISNKTDQTQPRMRSTILTSASKISNFAKCFYFWLYPMEGISSRISTL